MNDFTGHLSVLAVITLLFTAYLIPLLSRRYKQICFPLAVGSLAVSFFISLYLAWNVSAAGAVIYRFGNWSAPWGIEFCIDSLSTFMMMVLTGIGLIVMFYASSGLEYELTPGGISWYCTLYLLLIAAMVGIALTNDIFNLYVFIEISTLAACGIISVKGHKECLEASFKYLILSVVGSGCILLSIAMLYMVTGQLNFAYLAEMLPPALELYPYNLLVALGLLIVGLGVKSALFPLHVWLPDAHSSAPSSSSAVLSGLVIKIYAVAMFKLLFRVFPLEIYSRVPLMEILLWGGALATIAGSIYAIIQEDLKKMLAYSSIAQIGYVFLGIALMTPNAQLGGLMHILVHALMKAMLFLIAGIIIHATGIRRIKDLRGMFFVLPGVIISFTIGAASMIGVPLTAGLISKWYLVLGALDAGSPLMVAIIIFSSFLNFIYYFPIISTSFFRRPDKEVIANARPVPAPMLYSVYVLAAIIIIVGVYPSPLINLLQQAVAAVL